MKNMQLNGMTNLYRKLKNKIIMNTWLKKIIHILIICFIFISCKDEGIENTGNENLILSESAIMFIQKAGEKEIKVTCNSDWNVSVPEDATSWCHVEQNENIFIVSVSENLSAQKRETSILVECGDSHKKIPVRQTGTTSEIHFISYDLGDGNYISIEESKGVILDYNTEILKLKIMANVRYDISTEKDSWIKSESVSDMEEEGYSLVTFTVMPNPNDKKDRYTEITFKDKNGDYYTYLPVTQRKNQGTAITLTEDMFTITPKEGAILIEWSFHNTNMYDKIIFTYDNKNTADETDKLSKEVKYNEGNSVLIEGLLAKYGDITFDIEILNEDGESLVYNDGGFSLNAGKCLPVQPIVKWEKINIGEVVAGDTDGLKWLYFSGCGKDNETEFQYSDLVDGDIETVFQTENRKENPIHDANWIIIQIPDNITCNRFSIQTINATGQISQAPGLYTVSIGNSPDINGEWEEVFNQNQKEWKYGGYSLYDKEVEHDFGSMPSGSAGDEYRYKWLEPMSKKDGSQIKYILYKVTDRNHKDPRNDYFKLAEFEIYNIVDYDPENS